MNDPYELLRQKEAETARVRHEIESLQIVMPLLSDDNPCDDLPTKKEISAELPDHRRPEPMICFLRSTRFHAQVSGIL